MSKLTVLGSLVLVGIGVLLGVVFVSGSDEQGPGVGGARNVMIGSQVPVVNASFDLKSSSDAFVAVSKAATQSVVSITVTTSGKEGNNSQRDFFHFFGPDFKMPEPEPSQGSGSGVIITDDGYIATNNHVIDDATKDGIEVVLHDKSRYKAKLIGADPTTDLAVIKIETKGLSEAALGNSDDVQVGEWVLAIGNPLGLNSTVTAGIISAIGRNIRIINDSYGIENFIQTDAAINPGNSGGALVNLKGEVIGINTAIATTNARYQGYGFAVPINLLKTVATDLIKDGKVRRGYIGVQIQSVDQTMADALGLEKAQGVLVQSLVKGGAGESAGLKEGDVIVSVDAKEVNEANELQSYIATRHPGDVVVLKLFRDGKSMERKVTLKPRDEDTAVMASNKDTDSEKKESEKESTTLSIDNIGLSVRMLDSDDKKTGDVENGVVVESVKPYGEAFNRGIATNDVIVEADRKEVSSPKEFKSILDSRKKGDSVLLRVKRQNGTTSYVAIQIPKD